MLEMVLVGLLVAVPLLPALWEAVMEKRVVARWCSRGGPGRLESWEARHPVVAAGGLLTVFGALGWLMGSPVVLILAAANLAQLRARVRLHGRWHAGQFAADEVAGR